MSTIESNKTMAMIGSLLIVIGTFIPWGGAVVDIIGIIMLLMAIKGFSNNYQDPGMYQNAFTGIIYYIIAAIAASAALGLVIIFGIFFGLIGFFAALVVAFIFYVLAASRLRTTFYDLSQRTGEQSFHTAGTLLRLGALLTIVFGIGLVLIFIAWIFATIGFFSMRTSPQPYSQQPYGNTAPPPPPPPPSQPSQSGGFCPHCGAPIQPGSTFCTNCGKPLNQTS